MLKSCRYCGRYHDERDACDQKKAAMEKHAEWLRAKEHPRYESRRDKSEYRFRRSPAWTKRSIQVRERDHYLCLCCAAGLRGTTKRYNDGSDSGGLNVHHIIPVREDESLRLEESNLITLCQTHHHLCEIGVIPRQQQLLLVQDSIHKARSVGVQGF